MHFRIRNNVVQVIRTTYDKDHKKARNEIVGRLQKHQPEITQELQASCSEAELAEIQRWIDGEARLQQVAGEYAALTAAEQLDRAAEWFKAAHPDDVRTLALNLQQSWTRLRGVFKRKGLLD